MKLLIFLLCCYSGILMSSQQRYRMTVSDEAKIVYFRCQKCGNGTIRALMKQATPDSYDTPHTKFNEKKYRNYLKFSFVRNPWDRAVSAYGKVLSQHNTFYKECFGKDFDYFIDFIDRQDLNNTDRHIAPQTLLIPVKKVNFIGRVENMDEDLKNVFSLVDIEVDEVPHVHQSSRRIHPHYSYYYTDRTKEIIARKYKKDIEAFGYEFEDRRPKIE